MGEVVLGSGVETVEGIEAPVSRGVVPGAEPEVPSVGGY